MNYANGSTTVDDKMTVENKMRLFVPLSKDSSGYFFLNSELTTIAVVFG